MIKGFNKVILIGVLGRDPEMRHTASGRAITTFSVGTSREWSSPNGELHSEIEWLPVVSWGNLAEVCKRKLTKGQQVYIEGRLQTRRWEDKSGNRRETFEIVATDMMVLGDLEDSESMIQGEEPLETDFDD